MQTSSGAEPGARERNTFVTPVIDLRSDFNAEDDDGQNWALLDSAFDPQQVQVGAVLVAGAPDFWAVVRITAVGDDGQVHFVQLNDGDPAACKLLSLPAVTAMTGSQQKTPRPPPR
jgi:hypothetical protein